VRHKHITAFQIWKPACPLSAVSTDCHHAIRCSEQLLTRHTFPCLFSRQCSQTDSLLHYSYPVIYWFSSQNIHINIHVMTFINVKFGGGWQVPERGLGFPTVCRERGAVSAIISPIHGTCFRGFVMGTKVTQNILLSNSPNWANLFSLSKNPESISTYCRLKTKGIPACGWYETPQSFSEWQNRRCLKFRHLQHKNVIQLHVILTD
jgi:hypothetical protein